MILFCSPCVTLVEVISIINSREYDTRVKRMDDKNKPWRENCSVDMLSRLEKHMMLDR